MLTTAIMSRCRTLLALLLVAGIPASAEPPRGLWLLPRRDPANTARSDVPGRMRRAPREIWHYGGIDESFAYVAPVRIRGAELYFGQVRTGLRLVRPDGRIIWRVPNAGVGTVVDVGDYGGKVRALVTIGSQGFALIDAGTGRTLWQWSTPQGSFLNAYRVLREGKRVRLFVFPQNSLFGFAFDLAPVSGRPALLWQHEYRDAFWANFGPSFVLKDMDRDGRPDIVLAGKPGYMAVIDADTGATKFDLHYDVPGADHFGRPYGLLEATDIDGDGYPDIVMASCQVEAYIAVVHNDGGKRLRLLWSRYVDQQFPKELRELRPNVTSMVDLRGDGRREMVVGLFNMTGDNRWHTLVIDPIRGFDARIADLPDRYFWGCYDLASDGRPLIITSTEKARQPAALGTIQAVDGRTFRDVASIDNAAFSLTNLSLPVSIAFMANRVTPAWVDRAGAAGGLVVRRQGSSAAEEIWRIRGGTSSFEPLTLSAVSRTVLVSKGAGHIERTDRAIPAPRGESGPRAYAPLVASAAGRRELVLALSNDAVIGGEPDFAHPGRFLRSWNVPGTMPACWMGPDGSRAVCTVLPEGFAVSHPVGTASGSACEPDLVVRTPDPVRGRGYPSGCSGLLPFGRDRLSVYAGMQTGVHTIAGALYDDTGRRLWLAPEDGPYPRSPAAADLQGAGRTSIVLDDHGREMLYDDLGHGKMVAQGWYDTIPGRGDGAKYSLPIVGPFGPHGETRLVMSSGLQAVETLDGSGARIAKWDTAEIYQLEWTSSAVGRLRATGWDVGFVDHNGVLHCLDTETCKERWNLQVGPKSSTPVAVAAGDIDGTGHDSFVAGLPNGDLVAVSESHGAGRVLWRTALDAAIRTVLLADVIGDGRMEIVVECDDGRVRVLK